MPAIAAVLAFIEAYLPQAIALGSEVAPLIAGVTKAWNDYGTANGETQADFDAFHVLIKPYEDDLAAKAAAAQAELDGGVTS